MKRSDERCSVRDKETNLTGEYRMIHGPFLHSAAQSLFVPARWAWKRLYNNRFVKRSYRIVQKNLGRDDFYYVGLAPGDPARKVAEAPLPNLAPVPVRVDVSASVRICLHLHYSDLWPEFETLLKTFMPHSEDGVRPAWGLIVTLTPAAAAVGPDITRAFPGARIEILENRGRDIGPFFEMLRRGAFCGARAVCKLHGKRSLSDGRPLLLGELWRRSAVLSLLSKQADMVKVLTGQESNCAAAGPEHLFAPSPRISEQSAWGGRQEELKTWSIKLGVSNPTIQFFAGSMLWMGERCLDGLQRIGLSLSDFEPEEKMTTNGPTYSGERIFLMPTQITRGRVALLSPNGEISRMIDISDWQKKY